MNTQTANYRTTATATRSKRTYPSVAQLAAGRKLINQGITALTVDELNELASHPYMGASQRNYYAEFAKKLA